jgi:uncharacterized protein (TIGR02996 family)
MTEDDNYDDAIECYRRMVRALDDRIFSRRRGEAMTEDEKFLAFCAENPHDDVPWLEYADWLDEHGSPERAANIRRYFVPGADHLELCEGPTPVGPLQIVSMVLGGVRLGELVYSGEGGTLSLGSPMPEGPNNPAALCVVRLSGTHPVDLTTMGDGGRRRTGVSLEGWGVVTRKGVVQHFHIVTPDMYRPVSGPVSAVGTGGGLQLDTFHFEVGTEIKINNVVASLT